MQLDYHTAQTIKLCDMLLDGWSIECGTGSVDMNTVLARVFTDPAWPDIAERLALSSTDYQVRLASLAYKRLVARHAAGVAGDLVEALPPVAVSLVAGCSRRVAKLLPSLISTYA